MGMFGGAASGGMYAAEEALLSLMTGAQPGASSYYTAYAEASLETVNEDGSCTIRTASNAQLVTEVVHQVAILIGSGPDLQILPTDVKRSLPTEPLTGLFKTD